MSAPPIRFSTQAISAHERFEFFSDALRHSLWQVTGWSGLPAEFFVEMEGAPLGCLTTVSERICAHHSHRTRADVERSSERSYHMFLGTGAPWGFTHRGRDGLLEAGDVVIIGEGEHETHAPRGFEGVIVKCPERWIQTWLPDPERVTGHAIRHDSRWGRVLSPTLRQLTPAFATALPLPAEVIVDHLGAVLALIAGEDADGNADVHLLARIRDRVRARCREAGLTARDVADSLDVPTRVLHRTLATARTSFATELSHARVDAEFKRVARPGDARSARPRPDRRPPRGVA